MTEPAAESTQLRTVRARAVWQGRYRTALYVRDFPPFFTAEPEKLGGDDSAPTPMETVLAAYNGCLAVVIEMVARELEFRLDALEIAAEGLIDRRGLFGVPGVPTHFQSIEIRVRLRSPENLERLELLEQQVTRRSPGHNLLQDAGIPLQLAWELVQS